MERVDRLQEKNSSVMENYVEHQKILVELGFQRKIYPSIESNTK